jgi:hypothetical protein
LRRICSWLNSIKGRAGCRKTSFFNGYAISGPDFFDVPGELTTAQGASITVKLNGVVTSTLQDSKFSSGPFALQFGSGVKNALGGPIKWRK